MASPQAHAGLPLGEQPTQQAQVPGRPSGSRGGAEPVEPGLSASGPESGLVWCGDITYLRVAGQWVFLAVVLDLYARRVVGWQVSHTPDTTLVLQALGRAVETRQPEKDLLFHSDQGVQYRSQGYQRYVRHHQISPSMSRKGNCWDNTPMERLFRSLKTEWMPRNGYRSLQETRQDVGEYLMGYDNRERVHSYNGCVTPEMQENQWQPPNGVSKNT